MMILLMWLHFFIADVKDGLGPFLGVYLLGYGMNKAEIGSITGISSFCGLLACVPLGALVDRTSHKVLFCALCVGGIALFCCLNFFLPLFSVSLLAQIGIALCAAFLSPLLMGLTLGMVGYERLKLQISKNESFKHAGQVFGALATYFFSLYFGIKGVFVVTLALAGFALFCLFALSKHSLDHSLARGLEQGGENSREGAGRSFWLCLKDLRILNLTLILFCFHLSNAAMLPLLSLRAFETQGEISGSYTAVSILVAQSVMCVVAFLAYRFFNHFKTFHACYLALILCFGVLCVRGALAANFESFEAMIVVQILDGIAAGLSGVVVPIFIAFILQGSGHMNAGFAFVMVCGEGVGASLSHFVAGKLAQNYGYFFTYAALGIVALAGLLLCIRAALIHAKSA